MKKPKPGKTLDEQLHVAVARPNPDLDQIQKLIDAGADLNSETRFGFSPLFISTTYTDNAAAAEILLKNGADPNLAGPKDRRPLHGAISLRRWGIFEALLAHGAQVNLTDAYGNNILMEAVSSFNGDERFVLKLLEAGADPDQKNNHGVSPRDRARLSAHYPCSHLLP